MISLDGVMQGPGGPEEDTSGGFQYGGWVAPYDDEVYDQVVQQELQPAEYLLGRKTFQIWENYWPHHESFWPGINTGTKYVLSNTRDRSEWKNSVFLNDLAAIGKLKDSPGPDLQVWGSSELVHLLLRHDLVDEIRLKIHPLILGRGKKLFNRDALPSSFHLTGHVVTPTGVIVASYRRAGEVRTGIAGEKD